jgi:hypothetical protein
MRNLHSEGIIPGALCGCNFCSADCLNCSARNYMRAYSDKSCFLWNGLGCIRLWNTSFVAEQTFRDKVLETHRCRCARDLICTVMGHNFFRLRFSFAEIRSVNSELEHHVPL